MAEHRSQSPKPKVDYAKYNHTERKRQQKREYMKRNRAKFSAYQKEFYRKNHAEQLAYHNQRRAEHPEAYRAIDARWRAKNNQRLENDPAYARWFKYRQARSNALTLLNKREEMLGSAPAQFLADLQVFRRRVAFLIAKLSGNDQSGDDDKVAGLKFPRTRATGLSASYKRRRTAARQWLIDPTQQSDRYQDYLLEDQGATYAKDLADYQSQLDAVIKIVQAQQANQQ